MSDQTTIKISSGEILSQAWQLFKKRWGILLGVLFLSGLVSFVFSYFGESIDPEVNPAQSSVVTLLSLVANSLVSIGLYNVFIKASRDEDVQIDDLFSRMGRLLPFIGGNIIIGIIVVFGLILLIIPGIIWAIKYTFVPLLIVDKNVGVFEALTLSGKMTEGIKWQLFGFGLVLFAVVIAGALALGVGLIIAIPVTTLAPAILYNRLLSRIDGNQITSEAVPAAVQAESQTPVVPTASASSEDVAK